VVAEIVRRAWRAAGWPEMSMTAGRWRRIAALAAEGPSPRAHVGEGVSLRVDADAVLLERGREPDPIGPFPPVVLEAPGGVAVPWAGGRLAAEIAEKSSHYNELIDLDAVAFPLVVRPPSPGDAFAPLGMSGRRVALRDFLRARRVPRPQRRSVPLLCDPAGVVWVVPHRIADRVRTTEATTRRLGLRWEQVD
jgi:tRNA(Ile)-lysidine synthase